MKILKACPVCHSTEWVNWWVDNGVELGYNPTYFQIACSKCHISTRWSTDEKEVIRDWENEKIEKY